MLTVKSVRRLAVASLAAGLAGLGALLIFGSGAVGPAVGQTRTIKPADVVRPAGTVAQARDPARLLAMGAQAHNDPGLSGGKGRACSTCHADPNSYNATFTKPWPHFVQSVKRKSGLDAITAEGMVQFCMISAFGTRPMAWDSETLAGLTAFVLERHGKVVKP